MAPFGAGGVADLTARSVAQKLSESLGQPVLIHNQPGPVMAQIKAKALRALALTGNQRSAVLPDVPTARESGVSAFVASSGNELAAPTKTPANVIARSSKHIVAAVSAPDIKKKLHELNVEAQFSSPEQATELLASEVRRWGDVITLARIPTQ